MAGARIVCMIRRLVLCFVFVAGAAIAQDAPHVAPTTSPYDLVSTVKPNHSAGEGLRIRMDNDAIYIQNASLKDLIANTYGMRDSLFSIFLSGPRQNILISKRRFFPMM